MTQFTKAELVYLAEELDNLIKYLSQPDIECRHVWDYSCRNYARCIKCEKVLNNE